MKNQNLTFQQFLERLKTIDVAELLDKAKSIKVEDIRSMKYSDLKNITKSIYFYPSLGILAALISSFIFLFPSFESLKNRQTKSAQYKSERDELPIIEEELSKRKISKDIFDKKYSEFIDLVPQKGEIILLPEILFESANRSNVQLVEFSPISSEDLSSCSTESDEERFNTEFNVDNNSFEDNLYSDDFDNPEEIPYEDLSLDNFSMEEDQKIEVYFFNIGDKDGLMEFEKSSNKISPIFESNYYLINIKANYLNSLNFLKYIQEYKMAILPYCFEPRMAGESFNTMGDNSKMPLPGEVEARIIVNIPNYKDK